MYNFPTYFIHLYNGKKRLFKKLNLQYHSFRLGVEIPIKIQKKNMSYESTPCYERVRKGGKKRINDFKDGFLILLALLNYLKKYIYEKNCINFWNYRSRRIIIS